MNYLNYSAEELAMDEHFRKWVQQPTPEIESFWEGWLQMHPENLAVTQKARHLILNIKFKEELPTEDEKAEVWSKINASRKIKPPYVSIEWSLYNKWYAWAAVVIGITFLASLLYLTIISKPHKYKTYYGEVKEITLPDGSQVILNAHSSLTLSTHWEEGHQREVWLDGEAFFKVRKKAKKTPFSVHTPNMDIQVLGTSFNVSNRKTGTKVVLNTGKIKLNFWGNGKNKSIVMAPSEMVQISKGHSKLTKEIVNTELYNSWIYKKWILKNTPLLEIAHRLEETFGFQVIFLDKDLADERMTGEVSTENLSDLIDALSTINGLEITQNEKQLYISR